MSAVQTTCSSCGRLILQRTADRNEGLCRPCASAAARIPPPYFVLPEELTSYLISVGEDPADYVEMAWQHSPDFVVSYVEHIMEGRRLYRVWSPRLREFAHQCRREHPAPGGQAVSDLMRAKQGIFTEKIARASGISSNPYLVSICRMPLDAMPVAERLWAGENKNYVLLTQEEQEQWTPSAPTSDTLLAGSIGIGGTWMKLRICVPGANGADGASPTCLN